MRIQGLLILLGVTGQILVPCMAPCTDPAAHAEPLGGWAGTYAGTGTVVFREWTTEYAEQSDIEPFSTVDTTHFEKPVTVVIDTTDDAFSLIVAEALFEDITYRTLS